MARGDTLQANAEEAKAEALRRAESDVEAALDILATEYARIYGQASAGFARDGGPTVTKWTQSHLPPPEPILTKDGQ